MTINNVAIQCQHCGIRSPEVLVLRGKHFLVALCEECSLKMPIRNVRGEELIATAVATDWFRTMIVD